MISVLFLTIAVKCMPILLQASEKYSCGEKKTLHRPYGTIERRVDCELTSGYKWVAEFKGKKLYGPSMGFDSLSNRKLDSCFYVNDEKEGLSLVWDTLGNVVSRATYHNGKNIGKRESYFAPGQPALIKNYNATGEEEGPWFEWWKNGNKKAEFVAKNGHIISGTEYYLDGKPRVKYRSKYEPNNRNIFKKKRIEAEAWAPNGKSTGKIVNGNGEWITFPDGGDPKDHSVFHEVYKDSLMIKGEKLDSAEIAKLLKP